MEDENKKDTKNFFPLFFRLSGMKTLIIGGGKVAERKVETLLKFGADITLLAPEVTDNILNLADKGEIFWIPKKYSYGDLKGFRLVVATTNESHINSQIRMEAEREKLLLNIVDKPDLCNVIFPAVIERGDLTVALASDGTVPFFTRALKKDLDNTLPQDLNTKVELAKEFRRFVLDNCSKEEIKLKMYNLFLEKYEPDREIWERWLNEVSK